MYTERTTCRVCGSSNLTELFSLGEQYVNNFVLPGKAFEGPKAPITLDMCGDCTLVQMRHTAPPDILYSNFYWYRSGVTDTMRTALRNIAGSAELLADLKAGDVVLDIGSNDGTLLRSYRIPGLYTIGIEPADNLLEEGSQGISRLLHAFWPCPLGCKAKVITAIGMFYDLDDPNEFIEGISNTLEQNGLFIAQLMCLRDTIDSCDIGNFAHEHLEFYSLESLNYLLNKHGLEIMDIERNEINGGSYRLYIRHIGSSIKSFAGAEDRIKKVQEEEKDLKDVATYFKFFKALERNKQVVVSFIEEEVKKGKSVWVYGASTKGNVILQYYGLDASLITGAAERSPEKWGRVTIGTDILIDSEESARSVQPDYFLVLPYAFIKEFVKRETEWHSRGGRFIVPLPSFHIL